MSRRRLFAVIAVALTAPLPASAQGGGVGAPEGGRSAPPLQISKETGLQAAATIDQAAGPMQIERVRSGVLLAPDFKLTEIDGRTSELVGGYGGWVTDKTFFVGGGGYWLANGSRDRRLGYGGVVLQWMARGDRALGYSIKGLVGGGESTLSRPITQPVRFPDLSPVDGRTGASRQLRSITTSIRTRQGFFVAEPELDVLVRITGSLHVTAGAGYRFIAAGRGDESRIRGAVGTVGLQLGGGF
jgi:hypothetical protein